MRVNSIQVKIAALIFFTLLATIVFVLTFTLPRQRQDILGSYNITLATTTEQLNISIRNIMTSGEAPIAVNTIRQLKEGIPTFEKLEIFRTNGIRAFSDNETLNSVNKRLVEMGSGMVFEETERLEKNEVPFYNENFQTVLDSPTPLDIQSDENRYIEYYFPILNYANYGCTKCHGTEEFIRGIACINISTDSAYEMIRQSSTILTIFFIATGLFLIVVIIFFLRRLVVKPLLEVGRIAYVVGEGDFKARVKIKNKDELGELANKINQMIKNVEERFKLSKYVSKTTDKFIQSDGEIAEGERKEITVLFSDVRGFTSYSENNDPQTVIKNLNFILQSQAEIVEKYGGDIDKFVGDELMAIFSDEYQAVLCAREMINTVIDIDKKHSTTLHVGIGINSGEVISGNIGSKNRLEFAVIGDTVNLASRFCGMAKPDMIVISQKIRNNLKDKIKTTMIPHQKIKGKSKEIDFYIISSIYSESEKKWYRIHDEKTILSSYAKFPFEH